MGDFVRLKCRGGGNGKRYLSGDPFSGDSGTVSLRSSTAPGTLWLRRSLGVAGQYSLTCMEGWDAFDILFPFVFDEPRYLDGNIFNGEVKLSTTTEPPFTGTRWFQQEEDEARSFRCLGTGEVVDPARMLDGWVDKGTVQLRPDEDIFTGRMWTVEAE
ncbi:hypothetical protein [Streptomyces sp. TBY4]|uniref:hypothetical protein n=1 Tax=Streptomyces sp. TBY4 TaxID=2962030 RepID=UPI0020B765F5|nr:hypothetical protein [Streptomyces sp. TBY4]MCP3759388.1 hypothetical protein [Streptomyces sp. TBY4]